jgi:hypothetical protein
MTDQTTKETAVKYPYVGIFIAADVIADIELTLAERVVLAYIDGFTRSGKMCFASSETLAKVLGLNAGYVRVTRGSLVEKGKIKRIEGEKGSMYVSLLLENQAPPARNSSTPCLKIEQPPLEIQAQYNNYNKSIIDLKERESAPPENADADPVDKRLLEAERYLAIPTGKEAWELDNQFIGGGRRPMKKYPALWFTAMELADAIEEVKAALSEDDDIRPVFKIAQSEALSQAIAHGNRKVTAYKYVTGFALTQYQESLRKATQLQNSRRKS